MRRADPHHFLHLLRTRRGAWALMAVVKTHTGWNGTLLAAIHDAFDEHYNDVNTKSIIEEKPRKQQKMQAIYADIDAVLMDRD